jgi:hypothetical protein
MVVELRINESGQIRQVFTFPILNVHHSAVDVVVCLFVFHFLGTELLLNSEVLLLRLLHLCQGCIIGQATALQFFAGILAKLARFISYKIISNSVIPGTLS